MGVKSLTIIGCLFFLFISCDNGLLRESGVPEAKKNVIDFGNKRAYAQLYVYFSRKEAPDELLTYSMIMAFKYNNADAYFNIYESVIRIYNKNYFEKDLIRNLDKTNRKFVLDNLIKAADLGNLYAKEILAIYYREGKYLPKNIELAKKIEKEIRII